MAVRVPVNPDTAIWARKRLSLSVEQAATLLKTTPEKLTKIEAGDDLPGVGVFQRMSQQYLVPEATLLGAPPQDALPLPNDFRSFDGAKVSLSYETTRAIRLVQSRQSSLVRLAEIDPLIIPPELEIISLSDDPEEKGSSFRRKLGFSVLEQLQMPRDRAFSKWRTRVEGLGVSVYVEPLGDDGARGVSLYQTPFPAIIVNQNEKHIGARCFTLLHELAHILLRHAGISDLNRTHRVERFCNRFAAAFLMPAEAVRSVIELGDGLREPSLQSLGFAADKLCVTMSSLALRLEEIGIAPTGYYRKMARNLAKLATPAPAKASTKKSEVPYKYTYLSRFGENFTGKVLESFENGSISNVEASQILNASPKHFGAFRDTIVARRTLADAE